MSRRTKFNYSSISQSISHLTKKPYCIALTISVIFVLFTAFLSSRVSEDPCNTIELPAISSSYAPTQEPKIPKIVHYTYFGGRPFGFVHWLAVRSVIVRLKPDEIKFHHSEEPTGFWWQQTKPHLQLVKVENVSSIFGNPVHVLAHKADITRLKVLKQYGGIYMDMDVGVLKSFDDLLHHSTVMGYQDYQSIQFCNAIILSTQGSPFLNRWLEQYITFDDSVWDFHSGTVSARLAHFYPNEIATLDENGFFYNHYDNIHTYYKPEVLKNSYTLHFWESTKLHGDLLKTINPRYMVTANNTFTWAFKNLIPKELLDHE